MIHVMKGDIQRETDTTLAHGFAIIEDECRKQTKGMEWIALYHYCAQESVLNLSIKSDDFSMRHIFSYTLIAIGKGVVLRAKAQKFLLTACLNIELWKNNIVTSQRTA